MAVENIVEELNKLSVLELVELKKTLEEQWGVTAAAAAPVMVQAAAGGGGGAEARRGADRVRRRPDRRPATRRSRSSRSSAS